MVKKIIVIVLIVVLVLVILGGILYFHSMPNMVTTYLNSKYDMNLTMYYYKYEDNGPYGINGGSHYKFYFLPVDGFDMNAELDFVPLEEDTLDQVRLNITNIEIAKSLKEYVERDNIKCNVVECREVNEGSYYFVYEKDGKSFSEDYSEQQINEILNLFGK